jgi:AraC family transcriptional regulator of adaptative response / DNA-3-methyladenine glycosylase II
VGASPIAIAQTRRLHFAKRLIDETHLSATEIALAAGYGSVRRFNEAFKATYKRSPMQLRKRKARGAQEASEITLKLSYRPPYDWHEAIQFLSERAIPGLESVGPGEYARYLRTATGHTFVRISACAGENALQLQVRDAAPADLFELSARARRVFDLTADPEQIAGAFKADPLLAPLATSRPGLRIIGVWDPFECAVRTLLERQLGRFAARLAAAALVARAGQPLDGGIDGLLRLFPTADELAAADLSNLALTAPQRETLRALCRAARDGIVCFGDSIEKVTASLTKIPGIDEWVAQVVALRAGGDPDAFPTQDLVLRSQAADKTGPLSAGALEERAQAWRPWRGYAACQLWAEAEENSSSEESTIAVRSARADALA